MPRDENKSLNDFTHLNPTQLQQYMSNRKRHKHTSSEQDEKRKAKRERMRQKQDRQKTTESTAATIQPAACTKANKGKECCVIVVVPSFPV